MEEEAAAVANAPRLSTPRGGKSRSHAHLQQQQQHYHQGSLKTFGHPALRRVCFLVDVCSAAETEEKKAAKMVLYVLKHLRAEHGLQSWGYRFFDSRSDGYFPPTVWTGFEAKSFRLFLCDFRKRLHERRQDNRGPPIISQLNNLVVGVGTVHADFKSTRALAGLRPADNGNGSPSRAREARLGGSKAAKTGAQPPAVSVDKLVIFVVSPCPVSLPQFVLRQKSSLSQNKAIAMKNSLRQSVAPVVECHTSLQARLKGEATAVFWIDARLRPGGKSAGAPPVANDWSHATANAQLEAFSNLDDLLKQTYFGCMLPAAVLLRLLDNGTLPAITALENLISRRLRAFLSASGVVGGAGFLPASCGGAMPDLSQSQAKFRVSPKHDQASACVIWHGKLIVSSGCNPWNQTTRSHTSITAEQHRPNPRARQAMGPASKVCTARSLETPSRWLGDVQLVPCDTDHDEMRNFPEHGCHGFREMLSDSLEGEDAVRQMNIIGLTPAATALQLFTGACESFFLLSTPHVALSRGQKAPAPCVDDLWFRLAADDMVAVVSFDCSAHGINNGVEPPSALLFPWTVGCAVVRSLPRDLSTRMIVPSVAILQSSLKALECSRDTGSAADSQDSSAQNSAYSDSEEGSIALGQSALDPSAFSDDESESQFSSGASAASSQSNVAATEPPSCADLVSAGSNLLLLCHDNPLTALRWPGTNSPGLDTNFGDDGLRQLLDRAHGVAKFVEHTRALTADAFPQGSPAKELTRKNPSAKSRSSTLRDSARVTTRTRQQCAGAPQQDEMHRHADTVPSATVETNSTTMAIDEQSATTSSALPSLSAAAPLPLLDPKTIQQAGLGIEPVACPGSEQESIRDLYESLIHDPLRPLSDFFSACRRATAMPGGNGRLARSILTALKQPVKSLLQLTASAPAEPGGDTRGQPQQVEGAMMQHENELNEPKRQPTTAPTAGASTSVNAAIGDWRFRTVALQLFIRLELECMLPTDSIFGGVCGLHDEENALQQASVPAQRVEVVLSRQDQSQQRGNRAASIGGASADDVATPAALKSSVSFVLNSRGPRACVLGRVLDTEPEGEVHTTKLPSAVKPSTLAVGNEDEVARVSLGYPGLSGWHLEFRLVESPVCSFALAIPFVWILLRCGYHQLLSYHRP
eukprot:INCI7640.3.p1 GENE.INCI7640.3~~INCI7640.3.p1  ORF type:complete len:1153 (-),score=177.00 INCI7640.3:3549-7007(-)